MEKTYIDRVHVWGRIWTITALLFLLCIPLAISIYYDAWPALSSLFKGLLKIIPVFWTTAILEVVSYSPILGAGGTYLSFVTGNITNLKLPCALAAMESADAQPNTDEGEVITTIAVATSALVTTVIIALGVLLFTPILPKITAEGSVFAPAFQQVLPALFGSIGAGYFAKHFKISVLPIVIGVLILVIAPTLPTGTLVPITIVVALLGTQVMYKLKWV